MPTAKKCSKPLHYKVLRPQSIGSCPSESKHGQVRKWPDKWDYSRYSWGMHLEHDTCYRALQSRDARFDGRFFTGVLTTGIYCRPVCPARTPLRKNVRFFPCAAAAEEAGFRACFRCRPETAPGSPVWQGTSSTVSRALRLIDEGALDNAAIDHLAQRLGVGSRHLRRLFEEHMGASPVAVAQTRRVHFARKLIDQTNLPMAEVAHAAGFASVRRFNALVKKTFLATPTELRRKASGSAASDASTGLTLRLPYRAPFDWSAMHDFLRLRATPGVEAVEADCYRRTISLGNEVGIIEASPAVDAHVILLRVHLPNTSGLMHLTERVRSMFDLTADPREIESVLSADSSFVNALRQWPGLRVPGAWDGFELAVRAILGQQISVQGATTLAGRLAERFGMPLPAEQYAGLTRCFPEPSVLANKDLSNLGLTTGRIASIQRLAELVVSGELRLDATANTEVTRKTLLSIPGIGPWTVEYIAMRALRDPDAFPASDLGLRKGAAPDGVPMSGRQLEKLAESWRPWRAYAAMYLWKQSTALNKQSKPTQTTTAA